MNGKNMLEAMSFIDEKYIEDADETPARRPVRWRGIAAAAACLAVVLIGAWGIGMLQPAKEAAPELAMQKAEDISVYSNSQDIAVGSIMLSRSPAPMELTVLVTAQEGNTLHCTVEDAGTGCFEAGAEITVLLPEEYTDAVSGRLLVSVTPGEDDNTVVALDWTQLEN